MHVLITGATGFIGTRLCERLAQDGHTLTILARNPDSALGRVTTADRLFPWLPMISLAPLRAFDDVDAVVHLAGESIAGRWNADKKHAIMDSRVVGTRNLVGAIEELETRPSVMVSASAVGYYAEQGEDEITEESPAATSFLADVCRAWEHEALQAEPLGVRVVRLRNALVLGPGGGALAAMLPPIKRGLGGPMGNGLQWWPWVHKDDVVGLITYAIENAALDGAVNAASPQPVRQRDFARTLAKLLKRPAFIRAPSFAVKLALGELSAELLSSKRVVPRRARDAGYEFRFPELGSALQDVLTPNDQTPSSS